MRPRGRAQTHGSDWLAIGLGATCLLTPGTAWAQSITLTDVRVDVTASQLPFGSSQWQHSTASHTGATAAQRDIVFIGHAPFSYGGRANGAVQATLQSEFPQLRVHHRANVIAEAQDGVSAYFCGRAETQLTTRFSTTGFWWVQFSHVYRGSLDLWGGQNQHSWSREIQLDGTNVLHQQGTLYDALFEAQQFSVKSLIHPGLHTVANVNRVTAYGVDGLVPNAGRRWHMHQSYHSVWNQALPPSEFFAYPATLHTVEPDGYSIAGGTYFGGDLSSLGRSDDDALFLLQDENDSQGEVIVDGQMAPPYSAIGLQVEASATRDDQALFMSLWDNANASYVTVGFGPVALTDQTWLPIQSANFSRFIGSNGQVRARVRFVPTQDLEVEDGWSNRLDQFVFVRLT